MGKAHVNYEPTEYEQMLIAAGWVDIESVDPEYGEYIKSMKGQSELSVMSHAGWQVTRKMWDEANDQYEKEIQPLYYIQDTNLTNAQQNRERTLMGELMWLEYLLGY
jgi:hypothetical protein